MADAKLKIRKDLAKKSKGATTIYVAYCFKEKTKYFSTKQKVEVDYWDEKNEQVKKGYPDAAKINVQIRKKKAEINDIINEANFRKIVPSFEYVEEQLDALNNPAAQQEPEVDFFTLFEQFIDESSASERSSNTVKQFRCTYKVLKQFEQVKKYKLTLEGIDINFYRQFIKFSENECGHAPNTIGKSVKNLKTFLRDMTNRGINKNLAFQDKNFKKPSAKTEIVYLTKQELQLLYNYDLSSNTKLEKVRDTFVFECTTGLRYSDLANLKPENIKGEVIDFVTIKTKDRLIVPLVGMAKAILAKYNKEMPEAISNQKMNSYLKELGLVCGLYEPVHSVSFKAGKRIEKTIPKYELITTHTARRTFITQALERGMRPEVIMKITGHKDIKTLMGYVKITDSVVKAEMLKAWNEPLDSL